MPCITSYGPNSARLPTCRRPHVDCRSGRAQHGPCLAIAHVLRPAWTFVTEIFLQFSNPQGRCRSRPCRGLGGCSNIMASPISLLTGFVTVTHCAESVEQNLAHTNFLLTRCIQVDYPTTIPASLHPSSCAHSLLGPHLAQAGQSTTFAA